MRTRLIFFVLAGFIAMPASQTCAQSIQSPVDYRPDDYRRFLRWTYQDGITILQQTQLKHLLYGTTFVAGIGALTTQDEDVTGLVQERYNGNKQSFLNLVNELGGPPVLPAAGGLFLLTLATDNTKLQDAAFTSVESILYAGAITIGLKTLLGRARPEDEMGAHLFQPFSGRTSWPSGHTATAFALVTPWMMYYPGVATYGLLLLSGGTAIARVAKDKHWMTDVLTGGAIGFLAGYTLSKLHLRDSGANLTVSPIVSPSNMGFSARLQF